LTAPEERSVVVNGEPCRVWEKGQGERLGVFGGLLGFPRWSPFLERLSEERRVIVPSLPGFPGGLGHQRLDDLADWLAASLDLLEGAGLEGADLVGLSVGGALAAEVAALSRSSVRRLILVGPLGLFDEREPVADVWAQRMSELPGLLSARPDLLAGQLAAPEAGDALEWQIEQMRASEAAARLLWPTCDRGLAKRLHRITQPTLVLWGSEDRVVPASYSKRFCDGIRGDVSLRTIEGAGHTADVDTPDSVANAILEWAG
jgi:pimeloyl-ACP methyl ester carboxylesterase